MMRTEIWVLPCSLFSFFFFFFFFFFFNLALWSPSLGKRELIYVLPVYLFVLRALIFVLLFLLVSEVCCGLWLWHSRTFLLTFFKTEPRHDKTNKMAVRPAKTQISLSFLHANSEDRFCHFVDFVMMRLNCCGSLFNREQQSADTSISKTEMSALK